MSGIKTRKRERQDSQKYERVTTALVTCGFKELYLDKFFRHEMDDDITQKCIDDPQQLDYYLSSIIPKIGHKVYFVFEFKNTKGNESEPTSSASASSSSKKASTTSLGRVQQPHVFVNTCLRKVKMEVDYVPAKAEPEETENNYDTEPEMENPRNQMATYKLRQEPREKVVMEVDDVLMKEEPEETENNNNNHDGEPEVENSINPMSKPKDVGIDQSKSISPCAEIQFLPLDKMTDDESLEFILKQLEIPESEIPEFREESKEFIELIGGLPLALQQAVAYIKEEKEERGFLGIPYKINDYVKEFKLSMKKFLSFSPVPAPDSSPTIFVTWNVTFEKIQKLVNGKKAAKILEILSFLYADKIPSTFLHDLVPEMKGAEFSGSLKLLKKYSMIKMNVRDFCLSIHRQLQFVILQYLKECDVMSNIVMKIVDKCIGILKTVQLSECSDIFLNVHQIVNNSVDLIPVNEKFFDFVFEFGRVLWRASRYSESLDLYKKFHNKSRELLGEDHENTLALQHQIVMQLNELGRYEESLNLYKEFMNEQKIHLGVDHPSTIATKLGMATVLLKQEKYGESLELFQQVLDQYTKIHGENHPKTLFTQNSIALVHSDLGNFSKALALREHVEKRQTAILGPHHKDLFQTKHAKAIVFFSMGKFDEASKILHQIYEQQKGILGENHLDTIDILEWIGMTVKQDGKFSEALDIYKKVYKSRKTNLGRNHPSTISTKYKIAGVLRSQEKYGEALELFGQVLDQENKIHGENHPLTLSTQNSIAVLHSKLGDLSKASKLLEHVETKQIEILGPHHSDALLTKHNKATVLFKMGEFQEAYRIFNEVLKEYEKKFGENHLSTITTLEWIAATLDQDGKLEEAFEIYKKMYEISKINLGENHPDTIFVKSKIESVERKMNLCKINK